MVEWVLVERRVIGDRYAVMCTKGGVNKLYLFLFISSNIFLEDVSWYMWFHSCIEMIHVGDGTEVGTRILDFIVGHILVFPMLQFYFLSSIGFLFLSSVLNKTTNCGGLQHPVPWLLTGVFICFPFTTISHPTKSLFQPLVSLKNFPCARWFIELKTRN